ncbi:MAG: hypothetical protein U9Q74_10515 [Gemmatimonadota bacterium]|nr:hypothetical protein [Gemmatimonadota bacterium]
MKQRSDGYLRTIGRKQGLGDLGCTLQGTADIAPNEQGNRKEFDQLLGQHPRSSPGAGRQLLPPDHLYETVH